VLEVRAYVDALVAGHQKRGGDGVIARLAALRSCGAEISEDEFHATILVLLVGGHRTTAAAIASAILAVARSPDLRAALLADPTRIAIAVEELLRYESPHQRTVRIARRETTLAGTALSECDVVYLLNGAANRDGRLFSCPDELRLDRKATRHLAFSSGIHFCIGAPLARIELAESLRAFLLRYPDLHVAREPAWLVNHTLRTMTSLWVESGSGRV
jgi:cytochrome P450